MAKLVTRTQYVVNTEDILDFAVTKLQEYDGWNVKKFSTKPASISPKT